MISAIDPAIVVCQRLGIDDQRDDIGREPITVADDTQPDIVAVQLGDLAAQVMPQQSHEVIDLRERPLPVFRREAEQRQIRDAELGGRGQRTPHRLGAAAVTGNARQAASLRPAAVAIHDDRDVARRQRAGRSNVRAHQT